MKNNIITTKTPLRISFFGGGTDINSFYKKYSGGVFSTTINKYIYVTVKEHKKIFAEKYRLNYSTSERKKKITDIKNNIIRETIKLLKIKRPLYISSVADVPNKSGLGSSSAFTVGLIKALCELESKKISKRKLAELACEVEIKILKNPIGKQDQYAAAYGGVNHIFFLKNSTVKVRYKKKYIRFIKKLFQNSLLLYTGITRNASDILEAQKKQKKIFVKLLKINNICNNFLKIKNKKLTMNIFQNYLDENWKIKKDLTNKTSNNKIDKIYKLSKLNGAMSLKLLGAGGGGFFFVIIDKKKKKIFKKRMSKYKILDLEYENEGSKVILKN
jgi:D-glycero-alpha-D-manno-heptose-7-phosphate kinase